MRCFFICLISIILLVSCGCSSDKSLTATRTSYGCTITIEAVTGQLSPGKASRLLDEAIKVFDKRLGLIYGEDSIIQELNRERGPMEIPVELCALFSTIEKLRGKTKDHWHPFLGEVRQLWQSEDDVESTRFTDSLSVLVEAALNTKINLDENTIAIEGQGDLYIEGIALGWAVDEAAEVMLNGGVEAAFIKADGVYRFWGQPDPEERWLIEIKADPDTMIYHIKPDAGGICEIEPGKTVVDSMGIRWHNIIDPLSGNLVEGPVRLIAWAADALSSCILAETMYAMGRDRVFLWADRQDSVNVFILRPDSFGFIGESNNRMSPWISTYLP